MSKTGILTAAFTLLYQTIAFADQVAAIECKKVPGMIAGPVVPTPDAAREIYLAVAKSRGDKILAANDIRVQDEGDRWSVFQFAGQPTRGGGTLEMSIAKCDGSILAHYSR